MRCRVIDAPHGSNREGDNFEALERGPVVLARDENVDADYDKPVKIVSHAGYVDLTPAAPERPGTKMEFRALTSTGTISLVDYASVNNWNQTHICTWLPKMAEAGSGTH
jgi:uncharacterized protein